MRVLAIDIETTPLIGYAWGRWEQNISSAQVIREPEMLCFAAKWLGERKVYFHSQHHDGRQAMVEAVWRLLDEADVVCHYNGTRFDMPHIDREFALAGMTPPSGYEQIDLFKVVRRRFKFSSNKLADIARFLGLSGKLETGGFDLWPRCMSGDETAWRRMRRYNVQDTRLVEELYGRLQAWIPSHPSRTLYDGVGACPVCGADESALMRRGFAYTKVSRYRRWHCYPQSGGCGAYVREGRRESGIDLRQAA